MQKVSSVIAISLVATIAAAALVLNVSGPEDSDFPDTGMATEERILALETAVSEERQARQLLEDELLVLIAEVERLQQARAAGPDSRVSAAEALGNTDSEIVARVQQFRGEGATNRRRDAMIDAGISPDRADYILRRESEMRYESMQAAYEARNSGEPINPFNRRFNSGSMLREEIGDAEYEMYLQANNRSTSVSVSNVMASSPGELAGLQAGDEITGYGGQRIFSGSELIELTMAGGDGNVIVDVMRDGAPMQIVLPRGPIGVEMGRFRGR